VSGVWRQKEQKQSLVSVVLKHFIASAVRIVPSTASVAELSELTLQYVMNFLRNSKNIS
jgi:hypothetical protein